MVMIIRSPKFTGRTLALAFATALLAVCDTGPANAQKATLGGPVTEGIVKLSDSNI
jgi:hypothetical protein